MGPPKIPLADRFWKHVDKSGGPDACWPWTAYRNEHGYGHIRGENRDTRKATRIAWELTTGEKLDPDVEIRHTCDNPPCCNPAHFLTGSRQDNIDDMMARGRHGVTGARGERNSHAILKDQDVREIRSQLSRGDRPIDIALAHDVGRHVIYQIKTGRTWRHVA